MKSNAIFAVWVLIGVLALIASSWIAVPMYPVPITAQSLVLMLLGSMFGKRWAFVCVGVWFTLAMAGLPILADGKSGLVPFLGATAGFLWSFPFAAWGSGFAPKGMTINAISRRFGLFLALHVLILLCGGSWLAHAIGWEQALHAGVLPFVPGGILKSLLAAFIAGFLPRIHRR